MASVPQSKNKQKQDWQSHICQLVRPHLPEFKEKQECLDFLCGDGSISLELFDELPGGSRLVGMDNNRDSLSAFHGKLSSQKSNIFLSKQSLRHHPFGASVFDLVWGIWAFEHPGNLNRVLRTLYPVLKPGATLICSSPLHGSFSELYRFIQEAQDPEQEAFVFATREEFPSMASCEKSVRESGLIWKSASQEMFSFDTNLSKLDESFLMKNLFGLWAGSSETLGRMLEESSSKVQETQLNVSVQLGVFCATKPL